MELVLWHMRAPWRPPHQLLHSAGSFNCIVLQYKNSECWGRSLFPFYINMSTRYRLTWNITLTTVFVSIFSFCRLFFFDKERQACGKTIITARPFLNVRLYNCTITRLWARQPNNLGSIPGIAENSFFFTASRGALGPTHFPNQWIFWDISSAWRGRDVKLTTHLHVVKRLRMFGVIPPHLPALHNLELIKYSDRNLTEFL
jgi:hypothetical protein